MDFGTSWPIRRAAFEICLKYVEGLAAADQAVQRQVLEASMRFWDSGPLGVTEPEAWENMDRVLFEMGLVPGGRTSSRAYTNDYLPEP